MTTKDYADAYMSLHLIELVLWVVRCDCKAFWHSLVCKHLLAVPRCFAGARHVSRGEAAEGDEAGTGIQDAEGVARSRATAAS